MKTQKPNPRVRLLCFPYAGGGSSSYFPWSDYLDEDIELAIIQPPGRGARLFERSLRSMEEYVMTSIACIEKLHSIDTYFYGHSMGAKVAYEVCVKLQELGRVDLMPKYFFASACSAPNVSYEGPLRQYMNDEELTNFVVNTYGTSVLKDNPTLVKLLLPAWRADFTIVENFIRENLVSLPIGCTLVLGGKDSNLNLKVAGWKLCFDKMSQFVIPLGDHYFIERDFRSLIAYLNEICLHGGSVE